MERLLCSRLVCLTVRQKRYSAESFKPYVQGVVGNLHERVERLRTAGVNYSSRPQTDKEKDGGGGGSVRDTEELLAAVLSAHLVLSRMNVLFPWKNEFYSGKKTHLRDDIQRLAGALVDAWDLLGVSGEARRQMLRRLIVEVGRQTLEARLQIYEDYREQLAARSGLRKDIRGSAALRETEGKEQAARYRLSLVAVRCRSKQSLHSMATGETMVSADPFQTRFPCVAAPPELRWRMTGNAPRHAVRSTRKEGKAGATLVWVPPLESERFWWLSERKHS